MNAFTGGVPGTPFVSVVKLLRYQRRFNGVPMAGKTSPTLTLLNVTTEQAGSYDVLAVNQVATVPSEQGLPQNTVGALLQTQDGYLWAGTRYGLARFDGLRLTAYVNELSAPNSEALNVRGLVEDTRGWLWLHSWETLVCFHQGRFAAVPLDAAPFPGRIQHVCAGRAGCWAAGTKGRIPQTSFVPRAR